MFNGIMPFLYVVRQTGCTKIDPTIQSIKMDVLPYDIKLAIMGELDLLDYISLTRSSKAWRAVYNTTEGCRLFADKFMSDRVKKYNRSAEWLSLAMQYNTRLTVELVARGIYSSYRLVNDSIDDMFGYELDGLCDECGAIVHVDSDPECAISYCHGCGHTYCTLSKVCIEYHTKGPRHLHFHR